MKLHSRLDPYTKRLHPYPVAKLNN